MSQVHMANEAEYRGKGEIHFGWVLEGRAIQDVWITPSRGQRHDPIGAAANFYGSTFRIYDPGIDAWHIFWLDPVKQFYSRMIGRARRQGYRAAHRRRDAAAPLALHRDQAQQLPLDRRCR